MLERVPGTVAVRWMLTCAAAAMHVDNQDAMVLRCVPLVGASRNAAQHPRTLGP
jgi:hypothetical protein